MCPKNFRSIYQRDICTSVFIDVLVTVVKFWNRLRYISTNEWMYCHVIVYCCDKTLLPKCKDTKCSSSLQVIACYWGKPRQKLIAGTWVHKQKQRPWRSATYWLSHLDFLSLLSNIQNHLLEVASPRVGWTLPHKSFTRELHHRYNQASIW